MARRREEPSFGGACCGGSGGRAAARRLGGGCWCGRAAQARCCKKPRDQGRSSRHGALTESHGQINGVARQVVPSAQRYAVYSITGRYCQEQQAVEVRVHTCFEAMLRWLRNKVARHRVIDIRSAEVSQFFGHSVAETQRRSRTRFQRCEVRKSGGVARHHARPIRCCRKPPGAVPRWQRGVAKEGALRQCMSPMPAGA